MQSKKVYILSLSFLQGNAEYEQILMKADRDLKNLSIEKELAVKEAETREVRHARKVRTAQGFKKISLCLSNEKSLSQVFKNFLDPWQIFEV